MSQNNEENKDIISHFRLNAAGTVYFQSESPNYLIYPTPELEILYNIKAFKKISVVAGLKYTYSYGYHDLGYKSEWRRISHEFALPMFLEYNIGKFISINGGTAIGYLIKGKEEYRSNIPAHKVWVDVTDLTDYDESSKFYLVLLFEPKLKYDFDEWNTISFGPTMRYYIEDNWMKEVRSEVMIGITLQYSFRF